MKILLFLTLLFLPFISSAQSVEENSYAQKITSFPFAQLTGGIVLIRAHFDHIKDSLNFILDTGSGAISLDSATTVEFNINHIPSGRTISGIGGTHEVDYAQNHSISFPGLTVDSLDFYINDYGLLSSVYGVKIDGVIGYSILSQYIVHLNYDTQIITFYTPGKYKYPRGGTLLRPLFTALPIQRLKVKDRRTLSANFYFDTGAGLNFLISKKFAEDSALLKEKRKPVYINVQGLGGTKRMGVTISKKIQIGPYRFRRVPTNILDDEFNLLSYPFIGGLIGNDILRRFNVTLNYPDREIHLLPNTHFRDLFDYSYTGMNLYWQFGKIYIDDIIEGSPADKSGLKSGDILISVGHDATNNISSYKEALGHPGDKVRLIVSRNGILESLQLKVGRIY